MKKRSYAIAPDISINWCLYTLIISGIKLRNAGVISQLNEDKNVFRQPDSINSLLKIKKQFNAYNYGSSNPPKKVQTNSSGATRCFASLVWSRSCSKCWEKSINWMLELYVWLFILQRRGWKLRKLRRKQRSTLNLKHHPPHLYQLLPLVQVCSICSFALIFLRAKIAFGPPCWARLLNVSLIIESFQAWPLPKPK